MLNMLRETGPSPSTAPLPEDQQRPDPLIYLREYGAFADDRDMGLMAYGIAHALRSLWGGYPAEAADTLALLMLAVEQASMDAGSMEMGFAMLLLPDPPATMFERHQSLATFRQFPRIADQSWITTMLAYLEGMDAIATRRASRGQGRNRRRGQNPGAHDEVTPTAKAKAKAKGAPQP